MNEALNHVYLAYVMLLQMVLLSNLTGSFDVL